MLDDTLLAFQMSKSVPQDGLLLIEGWLQALQGVPGADVIDAELRELRTGLRAPQPDAHRISVILQTLAGHTTKLLQSQAAQGPMTVKLQELVTVLRNVSGRL